MPSWTKKLHRSLIQKQTSVMILVHVTRLFSCISDMSAFFHRTNLSTSTNWVRLLPINVFRPIQTEHTWLREYFVINYAMDFFQIYKAPTTEYFVSVLTLVYLLVDIDLPWTWFLVMVAVCAMYLLSDLACLGKGRLLVNVNVYLYLHKTSNCVSDIQPSFSQKSCKL